MLIAKVISPLCILWMLASPSTAATTVWQTTIDFQEFEGQPGGWESTPTSGSFVEYRNKSQVGVPETRTYNVISQIGTNAAGEPLYGEGQGANNLPMRLTTHILMSENNPWQRLRGGVSGQGISSQMEILSGTSRPGDWGVLVYEFEFDSSFGLTASNFNLRLDNTNGSGEIYEWAFVTINERDFDNPGFDLSRMNSYRPNVYSDVTNSSYFNPDGTVRVGGTATGEPLPTGRSISQHLAGLPANPNSEGMVENGWYAMDNHSVVVRNGPEGILNPDQGSGSPDNVAAVTGAALGLAEDAIITKVTVWMGYIDVMFDTNGNGRTTTGPNSQVGQIGSLTIGRTDFTPVPEPTVTLLGLLAGAWGLSRRRR